MPSRDALMLPDVLTEGDNLEMPPLPDASFLLTQNEEATPTRRRRAGSREPNFADEFGNSQYLQSSMLEKNSYGDDDLALDDDLDLGLDLGLDIEMGRDRPDARPLGEDIDDTELNIFGKDGTSFRDRQHSMQVSIADQNDDAFPIMDDDGDINMLREDTFPMGDAPDVPLVTPAGVLRGRISESPLSDMDPNAERENEAGPQVNFDSTAFEPEDTEHSIVRKPAQRARKAKLLRADKEIMISSAAIKAQQQDRSKILRPQSFLPRDPALLALMEMQRSGAFVSNILGDARSANWAPELRGMLSLDAIVKSRDLKRKRDSGIADMENEEDGLAQKSPRLALDLGDNTEVGNISAVPGFDVTQGQDNSIIELPQEDGFQPLMDDDEGYGRNVSRQGSQEAESPRPDFDETRAPLVHPADNGPVSQYTKHAVHLLRDRFGAEAENSPDKRKKASTIFQDLLPENSTSRADATKMFFEVLVLATKDAVKVEQKEGDLGGPIRIRAKRGLWGAWAEKEAGGEIAEEVESEAAQTVAVGA
jgi:cohesin complex subunit SCC1